MKISSKLVIKKFKGAPVISEATIHTELLKLQRGIEAIQSSQPLKSSAEELYRCVENMCTYNYAGFLYENLYNLTEEHLKNILLPSVTRQIDFLGAVNYAWVTFCRQGNLLKNIFLYLDRTFVLEDQNLASIWNMQLNLFKECVALNPGIRYNLVDALLYIIERERRGDNVDKNLLKSLVHMLSTLEIYKLFFEMQFLHATESLYKSEGESLVKNWNIIKYLKHVDGRCKEEQQRLRFYLIPQSEKSVINIVVNQLLKRHLDLILEKSLAGLIENDSRDDLSLLYRLLGLVDIGHKELCRSFIEIIRQQGREMVTNPANDKNMIQLILNFKDRIDLIVKDCFENKTELLEGVKNSFKYSINQRRNKPAELLAKYTDYILCREDLKEDQIDLILDKIMVLFRCVQGKDVFEAFYKRDLAKRLLVGKFSSRDSENSMLAKLKLECGSGYTAKLEGMFKDITVSQDINYAFKQHLNHINNSHVEMCVNVLTSGFWPSYPLYEVNLPQEMINFQNIFLKFYMGNHSGRKLQWQPNLGYCIIKANFRTGKKELQVSLFQTVVLLLFNSGTELGYNDIYGALNLDTSELNRTLQSLSCGKTRILVKTPNNKTIEENDVFAFNDDFTDKLFRIKVNQVQLKETIEEQHATEQSVQQDRQFQIDAAIVRIMKQKQRLKHSLLLGYLYEELDIPVKVSDFKKRIEILIERDYIERDKVNSTLYKYIA